MGNTSTTTTHVGTTHPASKGRIVKAYKFVQRAVTTTAGMMRLPKQLQVLSNLGNTEPFRIMTSSLPSLQPPRQTPKRTTGAVLGGFIKESHHSSPQDAPLIPKIILTTPNSKVTTPDIATWRNIQRTPESEEQFTKWKMGQFLSPLHYVNTNAARERRRVMKRILRAPPTRHPRRSPRCMASTTQSPRAAPQKDAHRPGAMPAAAAAGLDRVIRSYLLGWPATPIVSYGNRVADPRQTPRSPRPGLQSTHEEKTGRQKSQVAMAWGMGISTWHGMARHGMVY
ncbi:hypothetical protein G7Z17_g5879 [Cylindrodendrum hubeiense]|uniref:Uncharacterized protein n=1 Tax=Cylindrodendrum hubeiense TaxID=595255 RepID=A0A9P5L8Q1_9HYPO|nr:hypothetical protein G7Z17_g5879 [Cylindrodendrum hubeiense]